MAKTYTPVSYEWLEEMGELSDAEYGRLIRWCQRYSITGELEELSGNERFYAKRCQNAIDRFNASYEETTRKRKEAGRAGGLAKASNARNVIAKASKPKESKSKSESKSESNTPPTTVGWSDSARTRFTPPSVAEVEAYCREKGYSMNPAAFCDFYASKGWKVGAQVMKDWKAAVRNWERRDREKAPKDNSIIYPDEAYMKGAFVLDD